MSKHKRFSVFDILLLFLPSVTLLFAADFKSPIEARAIWVTRWDYKTPGDIQAIINNVVEHHFNIILFQVRGAGTVCYPSRIEPHNGNHVLENDSWDPLAYAVELAHVAGIQLHAWVNVYPGWGSQSPPTNPDQLWNAHPDWFMVDQEGVRQQLNNHYVWLSPTHPAVRQYLCELFGELLLNWKIDGLHFDYIRYPGSGYSYDQASVALFEKLYQQQPAYLHTEWDQFRRAGITSLIDSVYALAARQRPELALSGAVVRNPDPGRKLYFQDAHHWVNRSLVDFIAPMIYTSNMLLFQHTLERHLQRANNHTIYPGILVSEASTVINQIELSRQKGCIGHCLFAYKNIFPEHQPGTLAQILKTSCYRTKADVPAFRWKERSNRLSPITDISTVPERVIEGQEINIKCHIPALPKEKRVHLIWSTFGSITGGHRIPLSRLTGESHYFITSYGIPAQPKGTMITYKIFIENDSRCSEMTSVIVHRRQPLFRQDGEYGPLLYDAQFIATDADGSVWVCERGRNQIRVLLPNGNDAAFSPITRGINVAGNFETIANPNGIAIDSYGVVYVSGNPAKGAIYRFDSVTGVPLNGIKLSFWPGEIAVDDQSHLFIIEAEGKRWRVFDDRGNELSNSPFFGSHLSRGIAVSKDGKQVYVACEAEGVVHCWQGAIQNHSAHYTQTADLPVGNVGMGTVDVGRSGTVYVSQIDAGMVTIFSPRHEFSDYLQGNHPQLRAPRGVALSADGSILYIVEWGIDSGTRIQRWVKN